MTAPVVARTRAELAEALATTRKAGGRVALVPTMGALHEGHVALVREAGRLTGPDDAVVVSIFVNPMQFGPNEDLARYPRTFDEDLEKCAAEGVDVVFAPSVDEVYPGGEPQVTVQPGPGAEILEGRSRPTHFRGVLTVVAKLFGLVRPDLAVFGQKDYQQLVLVRRMVEDLCMGVEVVGAETVREDSGLALSSRNRYLNEEQKHEALMLSEALRAAQEAASDGADHALAAARAVLRRTTLVDLDYLVLTAPDLGEAPASGDARMLVAARIGGTRLIDNTALHLGSGS
ncbi:MAG TPA: pantoate--beta-alanine ligase [Nocardioidaceae bacterium]|nr:pantoate--beta-alanine ligase [Nocardioidaceae bacterium]